MTSFDSDQKEKRSIILVMVLLIVATVITYLQVVQLHFINYDTPVYVNLNARVVSGITIDNIRWALTTTYFSNWHPLTWISHMLDMEIWGLNPAGHHASNLILHIANSLLLFILFHKISGKLLNSALVAGLFALHPLHIESVAWIAERKDLLATFFALLSILSYYYYTIRQNLFHYFPILFFFTLGLMAKPMIVTLPAILLLLDYWPLARFPQLYHKIDGDPIRPYTNSLSSIIMEKIPLILISILSSAITIVAQQGSMVSTNALSVDMRLANSITSYGSYILKTIWPTNLAIIYPHPGMPLLSQIIPSALALILFSFMSIRWRRTKPWFGIGWLWFLGTLLPVIGFIHVGHQAMADRYTYVPLIGLFIIVAWGLNDILRKVRNKNTIYIALSISILLSSSILTWHQLRYWQDEKSLFSRAIEITGDNYIAEHNLGHFYLQKENYPKAIEHFKRAIKINSFHDISYLNIGIAFSQIGDSQQAIALYQAALTINPSLSLAEHNLAGEFAKRGQVDPAIKHYRRAIQLNPALLKSYFNLGEIHLQQGDIEEATILFKELLKVRPNNEKATQKLNEIYEINQHNKPPNIPPTH